MVTCEMRRGAICTMMVLLIALSCCLTIIMTEWLNDGEIKVITSTTVQIFLLIIISMAILIMLAVFVLNCLFGPPRSARSEGNRPTVPDEEQSLISRDEVQVSATSHSMTVEVIPQTPGDTKNAFMQALANYGPLTIFGFCAILLDVVFEAPGAISCLTVFKNSDWLGLPDKLQPALGDVREHYNLIIAYALVKGACISLQVVFLCKFAKQTVRIGGGLSGIRAAVMIVLVATTSIFMYTFFREVKEHSGVGTDQPDVDTELLALLPPGETLDCFVGNSSFQMKLQAQSQYFYAFEIEFCLASVGLLLSLAKPVSRKLRSMVPQTGDQCNGFEQSGYSHVSSSTRQSSHYGSTSQRSGNEESISTANPSCEIWGLVFGFLFSVPLSVVEGLSSSPDSHITNLQSVQDVLEFVHYFSMLVAAIVVSVIILKHVPSQAFKISTSNILPIFAATGDITYAFLRLIPAATAFESERLDKMMLLNITANMTRETIYDEASWNFATNLVDIIQISLQTSLLMMISCEQFKWTSVLGAKMTWLTTSLQFLAMANFVNWLNASYLEFPLFQKIVWNSIIYTDSVWTGLLQFLFPVSLFFRFHSVHTLLEVYIGYKTNNETLSSVTETEPTPTRVVIGTVRRRASV